VDPWGKPCKNIINKLKNKKHMDMLNKEQINRITETLFITTRNVETDGGMPVDTSDEMEGTENDDNNNNNFVDMNDLANTMDRIKPAKTPGIDGIPGKIIKIIFEHKPYDLLGMMNGVYKLGIIPNKWKIARVILLTKPGKDPFLHTSYKPISILPTLSKVWEITFKSVIERYLGLDLYRASQFGFRRRRSTVDAIMRVNKFADHCRKSNKKCILMAIDIKNAFNTLRWETIIGEVIERKLPLKIIKLVRDYLKYRVIIIRKEGEV
jgi:hypothetical protein